MKSEKRGHFTTATKIRTRSEILEDRNLTWDLGLLLLQQQETVNLKPNGVEVPRNFRPEADATGRKRA